MTTENLSEPGLQTTYLKRVVWLGRSRTSETSIYFTSLRRRQVTNNEVSPPARHPRTHSDLSSETFGIQGPEAYAYTSLSNCLDVPGIDDVKDFEETLVSFRLSLLELTLLTFLISQRAMQIVGLTQHEQTEVLRMLAIILWLGNIQFAEDDSGNSAVSDTNVTDFVAYLMEVDPAVVQKAMTMKVVETQRGGRRGSVYDVPLNPAQAGSGRDALAKAIYNNLFEWIVSKVNVSMKPRGTIVQLIGILVRHLSSIRGT